MNPQWRDFLLAQGMVIEDGRGLHFGDPAAERRTAAGGSIISAAPQLGVIAAGGPDALKFLQGQLTNDIAAVHAGRGQISGYCTPKGRLLAVLLIARGGEGYQLITGADLVEPLIQRLMKYRLMAKVELRDAGAELPCLGLAGAAAPAVVERVLGGVPETSWDTVQGAGLTLMRLPGPGPRFLALGTAASLQDLWRGAVPALRPAGTGAWEWLDICAGMPVVVPATQEEFIPQTINLDALGGIGFNKGCYTGQEIVARVHYLGRLKQRMFLLHAAGAVAPRAGARIYGGTAAGDHALGTVVAAAADPAGGHSLLAVLPVGAAAGDAFHLEGPGLGPALTLQPLPYPIPDPGGAPA